MGTVRHILLASLFVFLFFPFLTSAKDISTNPSVIDLEGKPRDIIKGEITIKNTSGRRLSLFPDVREFDLSEDGVRSMTSWVEMTRGVIELAPNEERTIPYLVYVHYNAPPGHYHAYLWYGVGSFRTEAEANEGRATKVPVNVKVLDDAVERLQLGTFIPERPIFPSEEAKFSFGAENTGNRTVLPGGLIRIYNRRGREIATVPLNTQGESVVPESKQLMAAVWNGDGAFGRYKAVLDLQYGSGRKTLMDTAFFWVLPWGKALSLFTGMSVAIVLVAIVLHARTESRRTRLVESMIVRRQREEKGSKDGLPNNSHQDFFEKMRERKQATEQGGIPVMPTPTPRPQEVVTQSVNISQHAVESTAPNALRLTRKHSVPPPIHGPLRISKKP